MGYTELEHIKAVQLQPKVRPKTQSKQESELGKKHRHPPSYLVKLGSTLSQRNIKQFFMWFYTCIFS